MTGKTVLDPGCRQFPPAPYSHCFPITQPQDFHTSLANVINFGIFFFIADLSKVTVVNISWVQSDLQDEANQKLKVK